MQEFRIGVLRVEDVDEASGKIILTVEDGEGWSVADSIIAVNMAPRIHGVTLAYEYTDEGLEHLEA